MGQIVEVLPVKLVFGLFTGKKEYFTFTIEKIENIFGATEIISEEFLFNHTTYYEAEFGKKLYRKFIVPKNLYKRDGIAMTKIITNEMEKDFCKNGKRIVNIDPGYLTLENFILFTTKNYTHRIYLGKGIFADLTLIFQNKKFNSLPWTYPDYASDEIKNFLKNVRKKYTNQIKNSEEIINAKKIV